MGSDTDTAADLFFHNHLYHVMLRVESSGPKSHNIQEEFTA